MKIKRAASIPLITHDPFFSIWSPADHLYDADTEHWSGNKQRIKGHIFVNGKKYAFLGNKEVGDIIPQKSIDVTATATEYVLLERLTNSVHHWIAEKVIQRVTGCYGVQQWRKMLSIIILKLEVYRAVSLCRCCFEKVLPQFLHNDKKW